MLRAVSRKETSADTLIKTVRFLKRLSVQEVVKSESEQNSKDHTINRISEIAKAKLKADKDKDKTKTKAEAKLHHHPFNRGAMSFEDYNYDSMN